MNHTTAKRRKRDAEAKPVREQLIHEVQACEWCGATDRWLIVHEILRGTMKRDAQDQRYAVLVLCDGATPGLSFCHQLMGGRPWAEQLAILMRSRREDFDLHRFHELAKRRKPDLEEVMEWLKRIGA